MAPAQMRRGLFHVSKSALGMTRGRFFIISQLLGSGPINPAPSVRQIFPLTSSICAEIVVLFQTDAPQASGKSVEPAGRQFHFISVSWAACK
jgi:hypothetical protein